MDSTLRNVLAVGSGPDHFGLLPDHPVNRWKELENYKTSEWRKDNPGARARVTLITDCLDKLAMVLLQAIRIKFWHDELENAAKQNKEFASQQLSTPGGHCSGAFRGAQACGDFEGLLLQARAALDCLSLLVYREIGKGHGDSFRKLRNELKNNVPRGNNTAQKVLPLLDTASSWADGLMTKVSNEGLRDFVAHRGGLTTRTTSCFGFTFQSKDKVLLTDCETRLFPVFRTTHESIKFVSFLILNVLGELASLGSLPLSSFEPQWNLKTVVLSEYALIEPDGSPLGQHFFTVCRRMTPDGYDLQTLNVDPHLFTKVIDL